MNNETMKKIRDFAVKTLSEDCGYCGIAENEHYAYINSSDSDGNDFTIKFKIESE